MSHEDTKNTKKTEETADLEYAYYLHDLGEIIRTRALQAKEERDSLSQNDSMYTFQSGRLIAFNEVISIMQQQANAFEISLDMLRLSDIDPDHDLV